jgi:hypothetical protein
MRHTKLSARIVTTIVVAALSAATLPTALADSGVRSRQYDVVPSSWITPDGSSDHAADPSGTAPTAFIFPSLDPDKPADEFSTTLVNFFRPGNRFHESTFPWSPAARQHDEIEATFTRSNADLKIVIGAGSMARIRRLSWEEFAQLQGAFKDFLFDHSNCWFFGNCKGRFNNIYPVLTEFWRDQVLKDASFEKFAYAYLNTTAQRFTLSYHFPPFAAGVAPETVTMHATEVGPGEVLSIVWGSTAVYPELRQGLASGYIRPSTGGISQIQIHGENGLRLFPAGALSAMPVAEDKDAPPTGTTLLPFPVDWSALVGGSVPVFLPIYNFFDLHDSRLLKAIDMAQNVPMRYLFLLTPDRYTKADAGPAPNQIAQYSTDGRAGTEPIRADAAAQLSRRFILAGCERNTQECVQNQLAGVLDQAYQLSKGIGPAKPEALAKPSFTTGVFANQTFVEIRHHVSLNGRPLETTVPDTETWGTIVSSWMFSGVDRSSSFGSSPMLEIRRTTRGNGGTPETRELLFHTTANSVLNQAQVFEGDEFYGRPDVPAILR